MGRVSALFVFILPFFATNISWACSVCYGDPNSALTKGVKMAVLFLLGVVLSVLTGIASIAWVWVRRSEKLRNASETTENLKIVSLL